MIFGPGSRSRRAVRAVRSARRAGFENWFRKTVSVSAALTIARFQFSCTGDSAADTIRVPICTPSAPRANAAAIVAVGDAAGRDDWDLDFFPHQRQQYHRCDRLRVLETAAFAALHDQPINSRFDRLESRGKRRDDVKYRESRGFEIAAVLARIARRGSDKTDLLLDYELHDFGVAHEGLRDVHPERLVRKLAHLPDLVANLAKFARRSLDDAHAAGI